MTTDLDTRMRGASESLRRSVEGLPSDALPQRDRRPRVAAAVLVVALVAAVVGVLWNDRRGGVDSDVTTQPSVVPRLLPAELPNPRSARAADLPFEDPGRLLPAAITVYGNPHAERPFAEADLAVFVGDNENLRLEGVPVTVRGREGANGSDSRLGYSITWQEERATRVRVASRSLDRGQLLAIAEGLIVDGRSVTLGSVPSDVSGPLEPVGAVSDLLGRPPVPASASGHFVVIDPPEGDLVGGADIATFAASASELGVIRWITRADDPVEVRGHSAWTGAFEVGENEPGVLSYTTRTLVWEESPGVLVAIQAYDTTEAALLAIAEGLRPASDEEWQALVDRTATADDDPDDATASATTVTAPPGSEPPVPDDVVPDDAVVYLQGEYADGTWAVYSDAAGDLCGVTASGDRGSATCGGPDEPVVTLHDNGGNLVALFGVLPEGATTVSIPGGSATPQTNEIGNGRTVYAAVIQGGSVPAEVTFSDGQHNVVATAPVP